MVGDALDTPGAEAQTQPAQIPIFPFLWIGKRRRVGPYELIPKSELRDSDFAAAWIRGQTEGLLKMYEIPGSMGDRSGTIVRRSDGKVGDEFDRSEMRPLRRSVMTALLDLNPTSIGLSPGTDGWSVSTSDHALFFVHQLDGSGRVAVQYGRMVEVSVVGLTIGEENSKIHTPTEVHAPSRAADPDEVYAHALYTELTRATPEARRLARAVDWLDIAWRNTPSIDDDTRIAAIFSGFEVLLHEEGVEGIRCALGSLLDADAPRSLRPVPRRGRHGARAELASVELSDLEWWFTFFGFLRNDIAHGNKLESNQYLWNDQAHLFLGESHLRGAIKQTVANGGHREVMLDPFERITARFIASFSEPVEQTGND